MTRRSFASFGLAIGLLLGAAAPAAAEAPPSCRKAIIGASPDQATLTVRDTGSGLASILVTRSENADTVQPPFTTGTTDPLVLTSTKIDQTQVARVEVIVTDVSGASKTCRLRF